MPVLPRAPTPTSVILKDHPYNTMLSHRLPMTTPSMRCSGHLTPPTSVFRSPIAGVMVDAVVTLRQKRPDMLYAVPIKSRTRRKRGLNQSIFIVRFISRGLGIPLCAALLRKIRHTDQQSALSAKNRQSNLDNPFACRRRLDGRHVALIDDILTTGATANEISKILKAPGAVRVDLSACARTARSSR